MLIILLDPQLQSQSIGSPDIATSALVPHEPGIEMAHGSSPPLDLTHVVLNHQIPFSSNPILYRNVNQNIVTGIQNFTSHTQCVE